MKVNGGRSFSGAPQHKSVGIFFPDAQKFVLFSGKSNNCPVRNHTKFSPTTPGRVGVFIFGNLLIHKN
jgi:hypothetical protein